MAIVYGGIRESGGRRRALAYPKDVNTLLPLTEDDQMVLAFWWFRGKSGKIARSGTVHLCYSAASAYFRDEGLSACGRPVQEVTTVPDAFNLCGLCAERLYTDRASRQSMREVNDEFDRLKLMGGDELVSRVRYLEEENARLRQEIADDW